jgi:hypothetical protein
MFFKQIVLQLFLEYQENIKLEKVKEYMVQWDSNKLITELYISFWNIIKLGW